MEYSPPPPPPLLQLSKGVASAILAPTNATAFQGVLYGERKMCLLPSGTRGLALLASQLRLFVEGTSPALRSSGGSNGELVVNQGLLELLSSSFQDTKTPALIGLYVDVSGMSRASRAGPVVSPLALLSQQARLFHTALAHTVSASYTSSLAEEAVGEEVVGQLVHDLSLWLPSLPFLISSRIPPPGRKGAHGGSGGLEESYAVRLESCYVDPDTVDEAYILSLLGPTVGVSVVETKLRFILQEYPLDTPHTSLTVSRGSLTGLRHALDGIEGVEMDAYVGEEDVGSGSEDPRAFEIPKEILEQERAILEEIDRLAEWEEAEEERLREGQMQTDLTHLLESPIPALLDRYQEYLRDGKVSSPLLPSQYGSAPLTTQHPQESNTFPKSPAQTGNQGGGDRDPDSTDTEPEDTLRRYTGQ